MRKVIIQGTIIGALVGFSLAVFNSFLVFAAIELSWPLDDPRAIVIFTSDFFINLLPIHVTILSWVISSSALLGGAIAGLFSFLLLKYQFTKKRYGVICTAICAIVGGVYLAGWISLMILGNDLALFLLSVTFESPLIGLLVVIFPVIFFVLAGFVISNYLFTRFSNSSNANSFPS
jgi:hypothetical protein